MNTGPCAIYDAAARHEYALLLYGHCRKDNGSGKISDERFAKLSTSYEAEQAELAQRVKALQKELDRETDQAVTMDMFVSRIRKYTRAKKLTQRILNELVDYIEVYQAEKIDGVHVQKLRIHYNCALLRYQTLYRFLGRKC